MQLDGFLPLEGLTLLRVPTAVKHAQPGRGGGAEWHALGLDGGHEDERMGSRRVVGWLESGDDDGDDDGKEERARSRHCLCA